MAINSEFNLNIVMNLFQLDITIKIERSIKISLWKTIYFSTEYF